MAKEGYHSWEEKLSEQLAVIRSPGAWGLTRKSSFKAGEVDHDVIDRCKFLTLYYQSLGHDSWGTCVCVPG